LGDFPYAAVLRLDNAVMDVAPKVADNVAMQAAKKYKYNSLSDYINAIRSMADPRIPVLLKIGAASVLP